MALWRLFPETFEAPHGAPPDIMAIADYGAIVSWTFYCVNRRSCSG